MTDELSRSVADQISTARTDRGWTQAQLADAARINGATLSRFERDAAPMKLRTFVDVTRALGLDPLDVLARALGNLSTNKGSLL